MFVQVRTIIQALEQWAPRSYALPDDPVGLHIGSVNKEVRKVLVALDVTENVVDEAIRKQADLIVAHHPLLYRPLRRIDLDTPSGRVVAKCLQHDIAIYCAHTNLDIAPGGINDMMAEALGLKNIECLEPTGEDKLFKLVVYIPTDHLESVRQAIFDAGAGWIGAYSHCSFNVEGTGTFLPGEGTNPYTGERGRLSEVAEVRMETVVPMSVLNQTVQAMKKAHPYEEPAYDLYALELEGFRYGLGRIGELSQPVMLEQFADQVKTALDMSFVRVVGTSGTSIRKVAVLGGSGRRYITRAIQAGADVFVTGDIDYHAAQDALASGLALVDAGHYAEKIMKTKVAEYLQKQIQAQQAKTEVQIAESESDPFFVR